MKNVKENLTVAGVCLAIAIAGFALYLAQQSAPPQKAVFGATNTDSATAAPPAGTPRIAKARLVTTSAIAAYTYANGSSGVGATITANANGAIAPIDGVTPDLNDPILVTTCTALSDCGLYTLTAIGDGSNPFVLTRSTLADTAAELAGLQVEILDGNSSRAGAPVYVLVNTAAGITVGTTALTFVRASVGGSPRLGYRWCTDFAHAGTGTYANNAAIFDGNGFGAVKATNGTVTNNNTGTGNTNTEIGILTASSGTDAASANGVGNLGASFNWATNAAVWFSWKGRIPTLSTAAQKFDCHIGTVAAAYAAGVWLSCDSDAETHWRIVVDSAGTTTTASNVTITAGQWYTGFVWKDAGSDQVQWTIDNVRQTNPATTNTPTATLSGPYMTLDKSVGTTARTMESDYFCGEYYYPLGR